MSICKTCPFAFTDESEKVQNLGCLPSPYEIMQLKRDFNLNWSCHGDETKICAGYVEHAKECRINYKEGPLASYSVWYHTGY